MTGTENHGKSRTNAASQWNNNSNNNDADSNNSSDTPSTTRVGNAASTAHGTRTSGVTSTSDSNNSRPKGEEEKAGQGQQRSSLSARWNTMRKKHALTHHDVEGHMIDQYIHTGYRGTADLGAAFKSLLEIHNETMNIWTHLVGVVIFATLAIHLLTVESNYFQSALQTAGNISDPVLFASVVSRAQSIGWHQDSAMCSFPCNSERRCSSDKYNVLINGHHTSSFAVAQMSLPPTLFQTRGAFGRLQEVTRNIRKKLAYTRDVTSSGVNSAKSHVLGTLDKVESRWKVIQNSFSSFSNRALETAASGRVSVDAVASRIRSICYQAQKLGEKHASSSMEQLHYVGEALNSLSNEALSHIVSGQEFSTPKWPIFVFVTSAMVCLACSVTFHWFCCLSQDWYNRLVKMDYIGINSLIAGSGVPLIYYGFCCDVYWRTVHFILYGMACLASSMCIVFPVFAKPSLAPVRAAVFVGTGLFGVIPMIHMVYSNYDREFELLAPALWRTVVMGFFYIGGAILYAMRIPERFLPGNFDILFASHQIFHIMVVIAALTHYSGVQCLLNWYERASLHC